MTPAHDLPLSALTNSFSHVSYLAQAFQVVVSNDKDKVDPNVYYYSYSTLAQALAGAFGFLAAVVLYRLQALNSQLQGIASSMIGDVSKFNLEPFRTLYAYNRWSMFVRQIHLDQKSPNPHFKNLNFMDLGAMDHANNQIVSIRFWFLMSMFLTMAEITFALIALFLMYKFQSMVLLVSLLILGMFCLGCYVRLILLVLE
jgi:hypothetical protein